MDVGVMVDVTVQTQLVLSVHDAFLQVPPLAHTKPDGQSVSVVHVELHPVTGVGVFVGVFVDTGVFVTVDVTVPVCVTVTVPVGV